MLLFDNTRPHSAWITQKKKIMDFGWFVLLHPPDSSNLASTDFHLFHSLQNALNDKNLFLEDQVKTFLKCILSSKAVEFYLRGINKLSNKSQEVIQNNGERLLIEINSLFNYSWINHVLLKQKLFMTQPNISQNYWLECLTDLLKNLKNSKIKKILLIKPVGKTISTNMVPTNRRRRYCVAL